jgi:preprotein translocase subunit SecA
LEGNSPGAFAWCVKRPNDSLQVQLRATATEFDRKLAKTHHHITIEGDEVTYANSWKAAGGDVTWNMVHYDVQLIGGTVLHEGKIAEMQRVKEKPCGDLAGIFECTCQDEECMW